jgi:NAD-dependent deacetylase
VRPDITWRYLLEIERSYRGARFNRRHEVIAEMERRFDRVWTLTQNVDGFHHQAGSRQIITIHGDLHTLLCTGCGWRENVENYSHLSCPPRCPQCDRVIRPNVVLFDEMLPLDQLAILDRELKHGFDLVISVGTSSRFAYIAEPLELAREAGARTLEINPGVSQVSDLVELKISAGAAAVLDQIWNRHRSSRP